MRPLFNPQSLWVYPVYASIGGSFGYWLMGVEARQIAYLQVRRDALMEKRRRRAEREGAGMEAMREEGVPGMTGVGLLPAEGRQAGLGVGRAFE